MKMIKYFNALGIFIHLSIPKCSSVQIEDVQENPMNIRYYFPINFKGKTAVINDPYIDVDCDVYREDLIDILGGVSPFLKYNLIIVESGISIIGFVWITSMIIRKYPQYKRKNNKIRIKDKTVDGERLIWEFDKESFQD